MLGRSETSRAGEPRPTAIQSTLVTPDSIVIRWRVRATRRCAYMLQRPDLFGIPYRALVLRLPLQVALLMLIAWATFPRRRRTPECQGSVPFRAGRVGVGIPCSRSASVL